MIPRKPLILLFIFCICSLATVGESAGRGGGGGGGRGFSGGGGHMQAAPHFEGARPMGGGQPHFAGNNISRTPSMSRAGSWSPSAGAFRQPNIGAKQAFHSQLIHSNAAPSRGQVQQFLHKPGSQMAIGQRNTQNHAQLQQFLNSHISNGSLNNVSRQSITNRIQNNQTLANKLRDNVNQIPNRSNWFNQGFWNNHHYSPNYWHNYGPNWGWNAPSWVGVNDWLDWGSSYPVYYDEGYPVEVTPDMQNYVAQSPPPQENYATEENAPPQEDTDWLPLGVFALSNELAQGDPVMYFQLVLNKDGAIEGSYFNQTTDGVYPIDGTVDKNSQQAVWKISVGENSPVFQTGIYNLTLPQTSVQVYFGDQVQTWLMARVDQNQ